MPRKHIKQQPTKSAASPFKARTLDTFKLPEGHANFMTDIQPYPMHYVVYSGTVVGSIQKRSNYSWRWGLFEKGVKPNTKLAKAPAFATVELSRNLPTATRAVERAYRMAREAKKSSQD